MLPPAGAHRRAIGGGVMVALAVAPSPAQTAGTLYAIEDQLAALIETAELVSPEQELEFRTAFQNSASRRRRKARDIELMSPANGTVGMSARLGSEGAVLIGSSTEVADG